MTRLPRLGRLGNRAAPPPGPAPEAEPGTVTTLARKPADGPPEDGPPEDGPPKDGPPKDGPPKDGPPKDGPPEDGPQGEAPQGDAPQGGTPQGDAPQDKAPQGRASLWRRLLPAVTAAVLVLAGCGFFYGAHQERSTPSAENRALTDADETTRVAGDVGNALSRVFSYTPDGLAATERSARSVLAGRAARQYAELMDRVRADLAKQRVTLSTQAVRTAVIELDGDSARLLVFLDQISDRGEAGTTSAAAQLTVTAHRERDQWRIVDIRTR